jgi:hypothetical protein
MDSTDSASPVRGTPEIRLPTHIFIFTLTFALTFTLTFTFALPTPDKEGVKMAEYRNHRMSCYSPHDNNPNMAFLPPTSLRT